MTNSFILPYLLPNLKILTLWNTWVSDSRKIEIVTQMFWIYRKICDLMTTRPFWILGKGRFLCCVSQMTNKVHLRIRTKEMSIDFWLFQSTQSWVLQEFTSLIMGNVHVTILFKACLFNLTFHKGSHSKGLKQKSTAYSRHFF